MKTLTALALIALSLSSCTTLPQTGPLAQPTATPLVQEWTGRGSQIIGPFRLEKGLAYIAWAHRGSFFFSLELLGPTGRDDHLLEMNVGPVGSEKAIRLSEGGDYHLDVQADDEATWSVVIGQ